MVVANSPKNVGLTTQQTAKLYLWYRVTRLEMKPILRREQTKTAKNSADISQSSNNRVKSNAVGRLTFFQENVGLATVEF